MEENDELMDGQDWVSCNLVSFPCSYPHSLGGEVHAKS